MANTRTLITSPVGRIVEGNLYKANPNDFDGNLRVIKEGPNKGQPNPQYYFALAIPKGPEQSWAQTPWGQQIYQIGAAAFPQACQRPDFAWKMVDGDSTIPNKRNSKPCDKEGFAGHWIMRLSSGFAPKVYRLEGQTYVPEITENFVKPGYFVQVRFSVDGNGNQNNPGVYLNFTMIAFSAYGAEIFFGESPEDAGFGAAPLPAGASANPLASPLGLPASPLPGVAPVGLPTPLAVVQLPGPVTPNPAFLNVPTGVVTAALPSPPAQLPAPIASPFSMTAKAQGTREGYHAAGWSDAQLIAQGYMLP